MNTPGVYIQALYTLLSEQAQREDQISLLLREVDAQFPNEATMHLVYTMHRQQRAIAILVELNAHKTRYTIFWHAQLEIEAQLSDGGKNLRFVVVEMKLVAEDMMQAADIVRSIVLTEYLKPDEHGKEASKKEGSEG